MSAQSARAGEAFVEVSLKDKIKEGARRIQSQISAVSAGFSSLGSGLAAAGATATAAFGGILAALSWPTKLAADMETTRAGFTAMLGDGNKVKQLMADLQKFGAETPFEFPELADSARMLLAFGIPLKDVITTLRRVGDVSSGIGAPLGEIAEIYGKARVQGRLFMEDINQLTGRGIPIFKALAKQFGVAESEIRNLVEKGQVNFSHLERAFADLTAAGGDFAGQMEAKSKTLIGLFSTFKDNIGQALAPVGEKLVEALKPVLAFAGALLRPISEFITANSGVITAIGAISVAGAGLGVLMLTVGGALIGVGGAIAGLGAAAPLLAGAFAAIGSALATAAPIIGAVAAGLLAIGATAAGILYVANQAGILKTVIDGLSGTFATLSQTIGTAFGGITRALSAGEYSKAAEILWTGVKLAFLQGAKAALDAFGWLYNNALDLSANFAKALGKTLWNVFQTIPQMLMAALTGGASIGEILSKAITDGLGASLNESIAKAKADLDKLTAEPKANSSAANGQPGKGQAQTPAVAAAATPAGAKLTTNQPNAAAGNAPNATSASQTQPTPASQLGLPEDGKKAFEDRLAALKSETLEMRLGADAFDLYKLKLQGVGAEQLREVQALQQYRDKLKAKAKAEEDAKKAAEDAKKKAADDRKDLMERGKQLTEEIRTPLQVFQDKIKEIDTLLAAGAIDKKTAILQRDKAAEDLNAPMRDAIKSGRNTIADINTQAAMDVVLRTRKSFTGGGTGQNKLEDIAARQVQLLETIAESATRGGSTTIKIQMRRL